MRPMFPTHSDCANFRNGLCILNGVAVDPKGAVCPNFTPKSMMTMPQEMTTYPKVLRHHQFYQPPTTQGYPPHYLPQTGYNLPPPCGYRTRYNSGPIPSAFIRGGTGFFISGGNRGGGRRRVGGGGRGRGRMGGGFAAGPGGFCVCPNCGYRAPHVVGTPCHQQTCPKCGSSMTRGS